MNEACEAIGAGETEQVPDVQAHHDDQGNILQPHQGRKDHPDRFADIHGSMEMNTDFNLFCNYWNLLNV